MSSLPLAADDSLTIRHQSREIRGIPIWLLKIYLCEIGGHEVGANEIRGPGWSVTLTQQDDFQIGSIRVGQVKLEMAAESIVFEELNQALEQKLLRAGG